jgi:hypothetical protein
VVGGCLVSERDTASIFKVEAESGQHVPLKRLNSNRCAVIGL